MEVIVMSIVTTTIKGQIVIPASIRKKFGLKQGSKVNIYEHNKKIILEPVHQDPITEGRGILKTKGRVLMRLLEERKREAKQ
jgi:AbrB family looped-hinge helix DNA binding protein